MNHIKKIIKNEVGSLNEDEMDIFKRSIEDMFLNLAESISVKQKDLEKSIENSMKSIKSEITITSTLISTNEIKYYSDVFFPVINEKENYSNESILKAIKNGEEIKINKLFFENNPIEMIDEDKVFFGGINSGEINYEIKLKLVKYNGYKDEVKKIYSYCKNNFIKWNTPNMPYLNKFYELEIIEISGNIDDIEQIDDIYFNLEELEGEYTKNLCAVWNIKKIEQLNSKDPVLMSKGIFRHKTGLSNRDNAIIINKDYRILSLDYDNENILELTTNKSEIKVWNFYFIDNPEYNKKYSNGLFPVWTNKINKNFISQYSEFYNQRIRSMAEIRKILKSMEGAGDFMLKDISVVDFYSNNQEFFTYEVNDYIIDDIRENSKIDFMIIQFEVEEKNHFSMDILSYITSEIQLIFPEYKCVGELL